MIRRGDREDLGRLLKTTGSNSETEGERLKLKIKGVIRRVAEHVFCGSFFFCFRIENE